MNIEELMVAREELKNVYEEEKINSLGKSKNILRDELNDIAWYKANSDKITHEVGTKKHK